MPLTEMKALRQWVPVMYVPTSVPGKMDKVPVGTDRFPINHLLPLNQMPYQDAIAIASSGGTNYGVGFVFTKDDPFFFVDIDDAWDGNSWSPLSEMICAEFAGCAILISSSGTGKHIYGKCNKTHIGDHRCKNKELGLELYTEGRFAAVSEVHAVGSCSTEATPVVENFIMRYLPPVTEETAGDISSYSTPRNDWSGPTDDSELLAMAMRSSSGRSLLGRSASFADLWNRNTDVLSTVYPDTYGGGREYDYSSADAALAQHLAFWTGCDAPRIERLMRMSSLYRSKWDYHRNYLSNITIRRACGKQKSVYQQQRPTQTDDPAPEIAAPVMPPTDCPVEFNTSSGFMTAAEQIDHFKDCVYVADAHVIVNADGDELSQKQFNVMYGGYTFALDAFNGRKTTDAWKAFTESVAVRWPKVKTTHFAPGNGREIVTDGSTTSLNIWVKPMVRRVKGDAGLFLQHISLLLPDPGDQEKLLSYLAAVVQYQGKKFTWAPIIQGAQGNGKSLISSCLVRAAGEKYVYFPRASEICGTYNDWLVGKTIIIVEDLHLGRNKRNATEILKPMITATDGYEIEGKYKKSTSVKLVCNFLFNSNHKSELDAARGDRRLAPFFTAQQEFSDLERCGMSTQYFIRLFNWLNNNDGWWIVADWLHTFSIPPHLNPAIGCFRAPQTTSTEEATYLSAGPVESEILEAIDAGEPGFAGGWVSSYFLDELLSSKGISKYAPRTKRRQILKTLGFDWHNSLPNGRAPRIVTPDGRRSVLFIKQGHPSAFLQQSAEVAAAYETAQNQV